MIDIAMCTYNGARYIEEQIKSIQAQGFKDWRLLISDDGSTDDTLDIIAKLSLEDNRIQLVNTARQGGVINNFTKVLQETSAPYIALCDQDDIWPNDRLEKLLAELQCRESDGVPAMIYSDLELIDENGKTIAPSFYNANGLTPLDNLKVYSLLWRSTVYGCSTLVNRALLNIALPIPNYAFMHDQWLALNACIHNGLYYTDNISIHYRQHGNNVVGGGSNSFLAKVLSLKKIARTLLVHQKKAKRLIGEFYKTDQVGMSERARFISFANNEIFPSIFTGSKKMFSLIMFIMLVTTK